MKILCLCRIKSNSPNCREKAKIGGIKNTKLSELRSKSGKVTLSKEYRRLVFEITHHGGVNGEINGEISSLSRSLQDVYFIVRGNPGIKIKQVSAVRGKAESTVGKQLAELKKKGFIEYRGANKTGGYYAI